MAGERESKARASLLALTAATKEEEKEIEEEEKSEEEAAAAPKVACSLLTTSGSSKEGRRRTRCGHNTRAKPPSFSMVMSGRGGERSGGRVRRTPMRGRGVPRYAMESHVLEAVKTRKGSCVWSWTSCRRGWTTSMRIRLLPRPQLMLVMPRAERKRGGCSPVAPAAAAMREEEEEGEADEEEEEDVGGGGLARYKASSETRSSCRRRLAEPTLIAMTRIKRRRGDEPPDDGPESAHKAAACFSM